MKHIPNIITCLNLFSGCLASIMILSYGSYLGALFFILLAALFDFLDGFAARALKAYSPIGAELDSLADVISFGFAPSCVVFAYLFNISVGMNFHEGISFFAFLITIFTALRLAKFNIDTRQTDSFLGLPVPANGLFWVSLIYTLNEISQKQAFLAGKENLICIVILALIVVFCLLMISELPMFSLKIKNMKWKGNQWRFILIILAVVFILIFKIFGFTLTILTYILLSLIEPRFRKA